jgi:hypothetical protein
MRSSEAQDDTTVACAHDEERAQPMPPADERIE